jgi:hypothetical protein
MMDVGAAMFFTDYSMGAGELAQALEARGFESIWAPELVTQRDPIQTAKLVASLDQVSNGRFLFGIGGGWNAEEMEDHGNIANFEATAPPDAALRRSQAIGCTRRGQKQSKWLTAMHQRTGGSSGRPGRAQPSQGKTRAAKPKVLRGVAGPLEQSDAGHWCSRGKRRVSKWLIISLTSGRG